MPLARNGNGAAGALAAAHGKHHGGRFQRLIAVLCADAVHGVRRARLARHQLQGHGVQLYLHAGGAQHLQKAPGIFRAGELFLKAVQPKAVVDALV